ncbi:hypothetical protein SLS57_012133 [Botryosphaeria dothidea]
MAAPFATLRQWLNIQNPKFNRVRHRGAFRQQAEWGGPVTWREWTDFNIDNINQLFGRILSLPLPPPSLHCPLALSDAQLAIEREGSLDFVLARHNNGIVNKALEIAMRPGYINPPLDDKSFLCWSPGCAAPHSSFLPDWSAIASDTRGQDVQDRLPGESKLLKSFPTYCDVAELPEGELKHAQLTLMHANYYSYMAESRYCYIPTTEGLAVIRRRRYLTDTRRSPPGTRSRGNTGSRQRPTTRSMTAGALDLQQADFRAPTRALAAPDDYRPSLEPDVGEQVELEVAFVPWVAVAPSELSVNLALWALHMLARVDDSVKDVPYSPIQIDRVYMDAFL